MEKFPNYLKYTETHEWVREEAEGIAVVGITEHAQSSLGEIVYVELPDVDTVVEAYDEICVVESVKAASDVYSPLSGKIIAINEELQDAPSLINSDPYGDGWLYKIELSDSDEAEDLLSSEDYSEKIKEHDED